MGDDPSFVEGPWPLLDEDALDFPVHLVTEWTGSFNASYGVSQWDESLIASPVELSMPPQSTSSPGFYQLYVSPNASIGDDMFSSDHFLNSQDTLGHVSEQFHVDDPAPARIGDDMFSSDHFLDSQDTLGHVLEQFHVDDPAHASPI
jgi:hypothetical protein